MSPKEILRRYQEWYAGKFNEEAPLTEEISLRNFGHVAYCKAVIAIAATFKYDCDKMISYCDFVFKSWSETTGVGATIRYFPNWLASQSMIDQFNEALRSARIKKKSESHPTYSDHGGYGKSRDKPLVLGEMHGKGNKVSP